MSNQTVAHQKLVNEILIAFGSRPDIRVWPRVVGFDHSKRMKFGIKGESDIQGIISPSGRMLCIEVKTGSGRLTIDQKRWRDMILKFGGIYIEARSVEQALTDFEKQR